MKKLVKNVLMKLELENIELSKSDYFNEINGFAINQYNTNIIRIELLKYLIIIDDNDIPNLSKLKLQ